VVTLFISSPALTVGFCLFFVVVCLVLSLVAAAFWRIKMYIIQKYYFFFHLVAVCKIALLSYRSLRVSTIGLITISVVVTDRVHIIFSTS